MFAIKCIQLFLYLNFFHNKLLTKFDLFLNVDHLSLGEKCRREATAFLPQMVARCMQVWLCGSQSLQRKEIWVWYLLTPGEKLLVFRLFAGPSASMCEGLFPVCLFCLIRAWRSLWPSDLHLASACYTILNLGHF